MHVTGFTFIRNALKFDFPIVEAITSILPICDEFVVAVGKSEDDTLALIRQIDPAKIRIIETVWDESLHEGGTVYARETDKAFRAIAEKSDWAFYIQGDEVIHEKDLPTIQAAMQRWKDDGDVDGLLFKYIHFYGSYDYVGDSPQWYRHEIRIVKNNKNIYSYRDAQGFRKDNNQKLRVKPIEASVYHYGWVKDPRVMQEKHLHIHKYWYDDEPEKHIKVSSEGFDYSQIDSLAKFTGTHPAIMNERLTHQNWQFSHDLSHKNLSLKYRLKLWVARLTGWYIGEYRNYKIV
ncbi:glycosyl transferase [Runella slithyformis]|nr:glycosyl transferase [Runella slithyformis]